MNNVNYDNNVIVVPGWVTTNVIKNGGVLLDILDFRKMEKWFSQEQLIAIDEFSTNWLTFLKYGNIKESPSEYNVYSLSYIWQVPKILEPSIGTVRFFPSEILSKLMVEYPEELKHGLMEQYVGSYLKESTNNKDIHKTFKCNIASGNVFILSINRSIISEDLKDRRDDILYEMHKEVLSVLYRHFVIEDVNKTKWFDRYFDLLIKRNLVK